MSRLEGSQRERGATRADRTAPAPAGQSEERAQREVLRRVAITGVGAVTPLGNDAPTTWAGLAAGRSGVGRLTTFDASTFPVRIGGQVSGFELRDRIPEPARWRYLSRAGQFGLAAATEALRHAGVTATTYPSEEVGVAMGASVGRLDLQGVLDIARLRTASKASKIYRHAPGEVLRRDQNVPVSAMARLASATGPMLGLSTACSGSGHAIGEAYQHIQDGDATLMLAGGFDALTTWMDMLGFSLLGALTGEHDDDPERASRPFDADRSGFVIGEGAVVFALEDLASARARGAPILAELLGYGSTLNAYRITDSPPDGGGAIPAMAYALAESGLCPGGIDYVAAHGTGTVGNDASETTAIKEVFGPHAYRLAVSSPKSMTGHLTSAASALNLLAAVGAIRHSLVPPTLNLDNPDPKLDLDYVPNVARAMPVSAAMVNAFAFGGTNTCLVVAAAQEGR
jgi:3-oxoacyl-[acyl-carrier-protein] synthase II